MLLLPEEPHALVPATLRRRRIRRVLLALHASNCLKSNTASAYNGLCVVSHCKASRTLAGRMVACCASGIPVASSDRRTRTQTHPQSCGEHGSTIATAATSLRKCTVPPMTARCSDDLGLDRVQYLRDGGQGHNHEPFYQRAGYREHVGCGLCRVYAQGR